MKSYFLTVPKRRKKAPLWKGFFLNFEYDSTAIKPSDKRSDGLIYIRSIRVKSLVLIRKASLHFGVRYSYNLLPEKLPAVNPPAYFAVHSRFAPGSRIIVEGSILRWRRRFRKDREFSVRDIAGVALGPGNGCNVLYGRDYQILAKFAGSMEHADLMFLWLLQKFPLSMRPTSGIPRLRPALSRNR